mmetsp:Transcript_23525/g.56155  ORF Transcript_23525/g.56155 Transcript_23525/m.56155 type:complete len:227 (+) Transcript_23525:243-923(+)
MLTGHLMLQMSNGQGLQSDRYASPRRASGRLNARNESTLEQTQNGSSLNAAHRLAHFGSVDSLEKASLKSNFLLDLTPPANAPRKMHPQLPVTGSSTAGGLPTSLIVALVIFGWPVSAMAPNSASPRTRPGSASARDMPHDDPIENPHTTNWSRPRWSARAAMSSATCANVYTFTGSKRSDAPYPIRSTEIINTPGMGCFCKKLYFPSPPPWRQMRGSPLLSPSKK